MIYDCLFRFVFHKTMKRTNWLCWLTIMLLAATAMGQSGAQYRGFWVDTFNTPLNNHSDVRAVVNNVKLAHCNAIFAQVRRRGDAWYLNSLEPRADRTPIETGFDPLADLIKEAHAHNIEVHAFVIIGALWNADPTVRPPENSQHVFNQHGFNQATGRIYEGRENWLTRTLLPDTTGTDTSIRFNGHRFGGDFWVDLGHPDAADYSLRVLLHLVSNYDLDGLHLDRIRYPELSVAGQTPTSGVNIGYNETSVARFNKRYGHAANAVPAPNEAGWSDWRRTQVTNFVRRVYLNALLLKPQLKVSAALIAFGSGPANENAWVNAEAYWRVFQDWRQWTEEGILDYAIPMNYKREHIAAQAAAFDSWLDWTKDHQYNRRAMMGTGAFLNSIEGTLKQTRRTFVPNAQGRRIDGVVYFSFAVSNEAVTANPLSIPLGQNTPRRPFADFAAGLTTGKSVNGTQAYEDVTANPVRVFAQPVAPPVLAWKVTPQVGHLMGVVRDRNGAALDSIEVLIARVTDDVPPAGRVRVMTATDGNGFYGGVDLAPGRYRVTVTPLGEAAFASNCTVTVVAGLVSNFDITVDRTVSAVTSVSAASFCGAALAPESIGAAFGAQLAPTIAAANMLPLPTQLSGTSVKIKDSAGVERFAPLFFVAPQQINYQIPSGTATGAAMVTVVNGANNFMGTAQINRVAPALFAANANGSGVAAAVVLRVRGDGTQVYEPVVRFDQLLGRFVAVPIELGEETDQVFLLLFGTGVRFHSSLAAVALRIGDVAAEVSFAGATPDLIGLDQINARLPRSLMGRGAVEVVLLADGYASNIVQIILR
jgi:uncharacterized protein (TIGR03437 family)